VTSPERGQRGLLKREQKFLLKKYFNKTLYNFPSVSSIASTVPI
jgi:hypothetical protein